LATMTARRWRGAAMRPACAKLRPTRLRNSRRRIAPKNSLAAYRDRLATRRASAGKLYMQPAGAREMGPHRRQSEEIRQRDHREFGQICVARHSRAVSQSHQWRCRQRRLAAVAGLIGNRGANATVSCSNNSRSYGQLRFPKERRACPSPNSQAATASDRSGS
jgi:hypothetical protein